MFDDLNPLAAIVVVLLLAFFVSFFIRHIHSMDRCEKGFPDVTYIQHEQCVKHLQNGGELWELEFTDVPVSK